ncbi:hypothetical protein [Parasitella parasitica]|uniref:Uncharacterized protein n=1 Tax=Parasitella parasitica TaxID=35722 RepID=A0A0B7NHE9_9FUNG|nr:hypothetical protein [Parasitella parasitica]
MNNTCDYLCSQYAYWRCILSDDYMRNTKLGGTSTTSPTKSTAQLVLLHIDDHAWTSVVYYSTASKFVKSPHIYDKLHLDSGDSISQQPASRIILPRQKSPIFEEARKDWHDNRKIDAWRGAFLAKFAQKDDLQRALILTGWAKLVDKHGEPQHLLMKNIIRTQDVESSSSTAAEKEHPTITKDVSRRRIGQLKSIVQHLMFTKDIISEQDVRNEFSDAAHQEFSACVLMANIVKKFLPEKAKYHVLAYQLYFCIFANDVLEYTAYTKFTQGRKKKQRGGRRKEAWKFEDVHAAYITELLDEDGTKSLDMIKEELEAKFPDLAERMF